MGYSGERSRWVGLSVLGCIIIGVLLALSACDVMPPDVTYRRVPIKLERIILTPTSENVNNCNSSASTTRRISKSISLKETISIDEQEARSIALALGYSREQLQLLPELKAEINRTLGTGLAAGSVKTEEMEVHVPPYQIAVITFHWIETWEEGYIEVYRRNNRVGRVHYKLLVDVYLDSSTRTYDCTILGQVKRKADTAWNRLKQLGSSMSEVLWDMWNNFGVREKVLFSAGIIVVGIFLLRIICR